MSAYGRVLLAVVWTGIAFALVGATAARPISGHPGNVFLSGEDVSVPIAGEGAWQAVNYEGQIVAKGRVEQGLAKLGELGVGYYEVKLGERRVSVGVLSPLSIRTPATSPIGLDVAMSWFYRDEQQKEAVASLCALAGVNWVRDRLTWVELEPKPGELAARTRYDSSAQIQSAAGLKVLQVLHASPGWAAKDPKRFPPDLRDAYRFYREAAKRWRGQVTAFEPWNEADIEVFGGHTGAEMASMQKASYLGIKAGNPDAIACLNVFAANRAAQLEDLAENETWPYFETCNLHHYIPVERYPEWYAAFRRVSAGRPLWVTEFSMPVQWGDEKTQELSDEMLRVQAERVAMAFAASLHEGTAAGFYFLLPHYVEGKTQFGIVRRDLTPRPAYVALAAVGRLLADAQAIGKVKAESTYVFRAKPDGEEREVMVAWSKEAKEVKVPVEGVRVFDLLGREQKGTASIRSSKSPVFVVMPLGTAAKMDLEAAPKKLEMREGKVSPIVLQGMWAAEKIALSRSAYRVSSEKPERIAVFAYNFSDKVAKGRLSVSGPAAWKVGIEENVEISPGERKELSLVVDCAAGTRKAAETITIRGDFGEAGQVVLSVRLQPEPVKIPEGVGMRIEGSNDVQRWQKEVSGGSKLALSGSDGGVLVEADLGEGDRWVYPRLDLMPHERGTKETRELYVKLNVLEGEGQWRVILVEEGGAMYVAEPVTQPKPGETGEVVFLFSEAILGHGWSPADGNGKLDVEQVKAIKIGCNAKSQKVRYMLRDVRWGSGM